MLESLVSTSAVSDFEGRTWNDGQTFLLTKIAT